MMLSACTRVRHDVDLQGCPIWVEDGTCDCDAGTQCPSDFVEYDITGYAPETMHAPRSPMHACTSQELADFAACQTGDASKCTSSDASSCAACLISSANDPTWGPLVDGHWNSGGCVDAVLGQTLIEPSSCGAALDALDGCLAYACAPCTPLSVEQDVCDQVAIQGPCSSFDQKKSYACDALEDAGASADVCFPNTTIQDLTARQRDFITRIATYFCGP
jgi:hypothetical protein